MRMKRRILTMVFILIGLAAAHVAEAETDYRLGLGGQYWTTISSIDAENINKDGFSGIISWQIVPSSLIKFELDFEVAPDGIILPDKTAYAPQAYFLIGKGLYAGVGMGIWYADDRFMDEPFYALRCGIDLEILPSIFLDINGNYRFARWNYDDIRGNISGDTITLGTILRVAF